MRRPRHLRRGTTDPAVPRADAAPDSVTGTVTNRSSAPDTLDELAVPAGEAIVSDTRSPAELLAALHTAERLAAHSQEQWQRATADLRNFRSRTSEQQAAARQRAAAELIGGILEVLDDFERTLDNAPVASEDSATAAGSWTRGVRLVERKLRQLLQGEGLRAIAAVGRQFDPHLHEAVTHEESTEYPDNEVIAELRRGYMLHDRVLRPTLVRVANNPAARAAREPDEGADTKHG